MKKSLIYFAFTALVLIAIISCENTRSEKDFDIPLQTKSSAILESPAPLNIIPLWVKDKVNSNVYEKLKIICTRYRVDYSFLREDISSKRWLEIDHSMDQMIKKIEAGDISENSHWIWAVASEKTVNSYLKLERLRLDEYDQYEEPRSKSMNIFTGIACSDVFVKITVNYTYNTKTNTASNVSASASAISDLPSRQANFKGLCQADYSPSIGMILGSCGGTLSYYSSANHIENDPLENVQFRITP